MKIRSSETTAHPAANRLYEALPIGEMQGILIDATGRFSCCVEYVELENDDEHFIKAFRPQKWQAKCFFAQAMQLPFYVIVGEIELTYSIYAVSLKDNADGIETTLFAGHISGEQMAAQWAQWKGTPQIKPTNEANARMAQTRFDGLLESAGRQKWGGNVDGFVVRENQISALIECRFRQPNASRTYGRLEDYDPQEFFFGTRSRPANDFNTWKPLFTIKQTLGIPLILLCFEKPDRMNCSVAEITSMSRERGLTYKDNRPPSANIMTVDDAIEYLRAFV